MADVPEGSFTRPLEDIDAAVTEVESTKGQAESLTAAISAQIATETADKLEMDQVYGNGTQIPDDSISDFDGFTTPGVYWSNKKVSPATDAYRLEVKEMNELNGVTRIRQEITPLNGGGFFFVRVRTGEGWTDWRKIEPFGAIGKSIVSGDNISTLPIGRYYSEGSSGRYGIPSEVNTAFFLDVVNTITSNRRQQRLYQATASTDGHFFMRLETGNGWGHWYKYTGTDAGAGTVPSNANLSQLSIPDGSDENSEEEMR